MQESSLAKVPKVGVKLELDDPPAREEIKKATMQPMQLKVGKSPGIDGIPAEVYQHRGEAVHDKLQDLFTNCWGKGLYRKTSWVQSWPLCTKTREKNQTDQSIEASLYSPLQAKSLLVFY